MAEPDYFREFDFLPNLPKSNLDDRTFEDLVQECLLRIPRYCPEWTNHNPGDPGITLIELFAWLVDQMLRRFNQVPRRNYVAFLELLGIHLQPPTPAHVDLIFYLTKAQNSPKVIPANTEVATIQTETELAVVFTTDVDLIIGQPKIQGFFTSHLNPNEASQEPNSNSLTPLRSSGTGVQWGNLGELPLFENRQNCQIGDCFYLVLAPVELAPATGNGSPGGTEQNSITGNVLAITFKGLSAAPTGINPDNPPLRWEAWDGTVWRRSILRQRRDDRTKGFSFHELRQQGLNPEQDGADVILHLPQQWAETDFGTGCRGYWIRCVHVESTDPQNRYGYAPLISSIGVRTVGGSIHASECVRVERELLGVSDGKPGQIFQLQSAPVLERRAGEQILIKLPDQEQFQAWEEVPDFGNSGPDDRHYVIDSQMGTIQFGPLIREPTQLQNQTRERTQLQPWGKQVKRLSRSLNTLDAPLLAADSEVNESQEWQYGKAPPRGAEVYMAAYRVGGGSRGNVQAETLVVMKTAIPYVKQVINYSPTKGGKEAESLDEAVIRVPQILRTSQAAIVREDFENIVKRTHASVYRAHCLDYQKERGDTLGIVRLLIVPNPLPEDDPREIEFRRIFPKGMKPEEYFSLNNLGKPVLERLRLAIDTHKPLGMEVKLEAPEYVGVKVEAEVLLEDAYRGSQMQEEMRSKLQAVLYRFLNPITGGFEKSGWLLGRSLRPQDIIALLQDIPEVSYVGSVKLFSIRKHPIQGWLLSPFPETAIVLKELALVCSWEDANPVMKSGHEIQLMN